MIDGFPHGIGVFTSPGNWKKYGEFTFSELTNGNLDRANEAIIEGEWENGRMHGHFFITSSDRE